MRFRTASGKRPGFTLVELLVVISIIALLVALSMPALAKAKGNAQAATCGTRIRSLGIALASYTAEWSDTVPMNGVIMPKPFIPTMYVGNPTFTIWAAPNSAQWRLEFGALWPYMGGPTLPAGCSLATATTNPPPLPPSNLPIARAYICPTDTLQRTHNDPNNDLENDPLWIDTSSGVPQVIQAPGPVSPGYWSYSVNSVLNSMGRFRNRFNPGELPWTDPLKMINVKLPSDFITFVEEDNDSLFNDEVFDSPAFNGGDKLTNRHNNQQGNVGFGDGHVELFSAVVFNNVPSGISGTNVEYAVPMASDVTRKFFPDRGIFAAAGN